MVRAYGILCHRPRWSYNFLVSILNYLKVRKSVHLNEKIHTHACQFIKQLERLKEKLVSIPWKSGPSGAAWFHKNKNFSLTSFQNLLKSLQMMSISAARLMSHEAAQKIVQTKNNYLTFISPIFDWNIVIRGYGLTPQQNKYTHVLRARLLHRLSTMIQGLGKANENGAVP